MEHIDVANLAWNGKTGDSEALQVRAGVTVVITQAFGPGGEPLIGVSDVCFDGFPALTLKIVAAGRSGLVHLSPIHGDRRKLGLTDIPQGSKCELFCPASGRRLDRAELSGDSDEPEYFCLYLSAACSPRCAVFLSDRWGHFGSRIVDHDELVSEWIVRHY